ncbi:AraC family transcriptional regulator [Pseudomonas sp. J237]|nr:MULTISPECIES: bifunctional DNA-binding transcriptional regulator/O6-methylguanine-DNA methyltransferase Ada [Pseudomonas]OEO23404.1 AraC family transcriptional regulator [Pseudomonas sp. J237]
MPDLSRYWQAVCERDASYDGQFVFAVSSTGVYCRPSCPARRPKASNVSFHGSCEAAERAGFRPCKRCSPHGQSPAQQMDQLVTAACRLLLESSPAPTLVQLSERIGVSASHLVRAFKLRTGLTPKAWLAAQRKARFETEITTAGSVIDAALSAGYSGTRAIYQQPQALSPSQRRQQGRGETLRYTFGQSPLGQVLLVASDKGVCALWLGDSTEALETELHARFAQASLQPDPAGLGIWLQAVLKQIVEPQRAVQLPLDIRGTAFQQQVWRALQSIPCGQTRNYQQLALKLDSHPRAIARACASNSLALLIPCHRVINAAGGLSGYRWGIERKQALLDREQASKAD